MDGWMHVKMRNEETNEGGEAERVKHMRKEPTYETYEEKAYLLPV